ncbi:MAG TPA: hypothetical protein VMY77_12450 [Chitinophagaceae bacterium]|nr:hypothetical protein [Chitinophagaceae bacterium]
MKIEQVLVQQLYSNKKITLQGIGSFSLDSSVSLPVDSDKGIVLPENAISFDYNPRAGEDEALIDTIVVHTKKIKPLASADLDSFLMLGRQFLNIGKPFTIEGLGTLDKAQTGELVFIPGHFVTPKIEAPKALKENETEEKSGLFPDYDSEVRGSGSRTILIIVGIILLGGAAWAAYYFFNKKTAQAEINEPQTEQTNIDSTAVKKDTLVSTPPPVTTDGYTFKIVFKVTKDKQDALKTFNKFKEYGHKVIMYTTDSITYKVAEAFTVSLSDTTRIKDSLNRFYYQGKAHVEVQ